MTRSPRPQDISWFLDLSEKGQLDLDPSYQRKSVWSPSDRRFFIDTIMNGYPAPPVFLHKTTDEHGRATYHGNAGVDRLVVPNHSVAYATICRGSGLDRPAPAPAPPPGCVRCR